MADTYRQFLQNLANAGNATAQLGLNVQGDNIDDNNGFNTDWLATANPSDISALSQLANTYRTRQSGGIQSITNPPIYGGGGTGGTSQDVSFLNDQEAQLRNLLGRTDTGLSQGLQQNEDQYNTQVGKSNEDKQRQYAKYADQRIEQNKGKLNSYGNINQGANRGYRSLSQIIGRAAGTGSSAFRDLLPDVIGKDITDKRKDVTNTYGANLAGIDKAQGQYDISFADVLDDLLKQKKANEENLRTGIEGQRQDINSKLAQVAAQRAQAAGGGYEAVKAAQAPFQSAIENSRNAVEGFFNQFRTPYTPKQAVAATPDLNKYTVDRSVINAQQQGGDAGNPYAALLRKKLQGGF